LKEIRLQTEIGDMEEEVVKAVKLLRTTSAKSVKSNEWLLDKGMVHYREKSMSLNPTYGDGSPPFATTLRLPDTLEGGKP